MRRIAGIPLLLAYFLAVNPSLVRADDMAACKQIDEILSELRDLRRLVESRNNPIPPSPAPLTAKIDVGTNPYIGSKDAPITIVEFTDYQCPYCKKFASETFPELRKRYIDSGKVRYYVMDLPLDMHKNAHVAAEAARCAGEQGAFWAMHDRMQAASGEELDVNSLVSYAQNIGIDSAVFRSCVETRKFRDAVEQSIRDAAAKEIHVTPSFVIGHSTATGVDGKVTLGALPIATFERNIEEIIK
jgi:protein-disulfide isomerase